MVAAGVLDIHWFLSFCMRVGTVVGERRGRGRVDAVRSERIRDAVEQLPGRPPLSSDLVVT